MAHCNPSAGLSWSVGTEPEALYLSSSSTCMQGTPITVNKDGCSWVSHGFFFLTLLPTASPSPHRRQQERWGRNALAQDQGQSPEVPALLSSGANSLGVLGSPRDL